MEKDIVPDLAALAHPQRLAVLRLLMRRYPDRVAAGEIGAAIGARPSTLSAYLADLAEVGLIDHERRATSLLYRARPEAAEALVAALVGGAFAGRALPEAPMPGRVRNILFVGMGNAARSLMAEALLREIDGAQFEAFSAGVAPAGVPDPRAVAMLAELGHDTAVLWSKPLGTYLGEGAPRMDIVITLSDQAANGALPVWSGRPVQAHWGLPDPLAEGTAEALATTYLTLRARLERLASAPAPRSRAEVQRLLDTLAATGIESG